MSVSLDDSDELRDIYDQIYGFWENLSGGDGFNTLDELYNRGVIRRDADEYLFNLTPGKNEFTTNEIDELKIQVDIINANPYPQQLKDAMSRLLSMLTKFERNINSKAKNQALRNVYQTKTGKNAAPGHGPANLIRKFANIKVPKGAEGGNRSRKRRKAKKTRRNRTVF